MISYRCEGIISGVNDRLHNDHNNDRPDTPSAIMTKFESWAQVSTGAGGLPVGGDNNNISCDVS